MGTMQTARRRAGRDPDGACSWKRSGRPLGRRSERFKKLDTIAKRIVGIDAIISFQGLIGDDDHAGVVQMPDERYQIADSESGMRLFRRSKVSLHTEVDSQNAVFEPHAAAFCEIGGLRRFLQSEDSRIKTARDVFPAGRHGELHMIQALNPESWRVHGVKR